MSKLSNSEIVKRIIKSALEEDIQQGDITGTAVYQNDEYAKGIFLAKANGIIAGIDVVKTCFEMVSDTVIFENFFDDGQPISMGEIIATIEGQAAVLLSVERTALNFLQRLSGIATKTNEIIHKVAHTHVKILDTRKTVPGLRLLDKMAVKAGGGINHRMGLYDMYLIKDNHIQVAGSITEAVARCLHHREKTHTDARIEVEVTSIAELREVCELPVDIIMLDNFTVPLMLEAVKYVNGKIKLEASGGIDDTTVVAIAETGVDYISIGALTHSVKALDVSLELSLK